MILAMLDGFSHRIVLCLFVISVSGVAIAELPGPPDPLTNPGSPQMLGLGGESFATREIEYGELPRVPSVHAMISDVRDRGGKWVHQHAYLAYYEGRYWAMWSDGPGVPHANVAPEKHRNLVPGHDRPDTRVVCNQHRWP